MSSQQTVPSRLLAAALAAGALVITLSACGEDQPAALATIDATSESPSRGGTAVLGLRSDLDHLNPYLSRRAANRDVAYHVYASLAKEQADFGDGPPTFGPDLATAWEFSADGLELTFHLREDAVWSDGTPLTADDVRFSWQAAVHPDVAWRAAEVKEHITDVRVDAPHTATVVFSRAYPYQLMDANDGPILPRHVWEKVPFADWQTSGLDRQPVCSGPFRVEHWVPNQAIEMVRNERYWDDARPYLDRVIYRVTPDAPAGLAQLLTGELDFWNGVATDDARRVEADPRVVLHRFPDRFHGFLMWNTARPLFADATVRRALTLAINRQRIVDDRLAGVGSLASGPLPPLYWVHDKTLAAHPYDPAAARRLLAAAGWRDSDDDGWLDRDGQTFVFDLESPAASTVRQDVALMVQEDLKLVGVQVKPTVLETNIFNTQHAAHDFDAFLGGWRLPTKVDLTVMFATTAIESGVNYGGYSNAHLDDLLARAAAAATPADSQPFFHEALRVLHDDAPYTFLYWSERLVGINSRIRGAQPNAQSALFNLDEWWIPAELRQP